MRSALLVFNPALAPAQLARLRRAERELALRGVRLTKHAVAGGLPTRQAVSRLAPGRDFVIGAGGDGTVNSVAAGMMDLRTRPPLAILPFGTANDIGRQLGVSSLAAAISAATTGVPTLTDIIEIQPEAGQLAQFALNFAACGFATDLLRATSPRLKRWLGRRLCYWASFAVALGRHRPLALDIRSPSLKFGGPAFHAGAGNLESAGGGLMRLSPGACPTDGQIEFCVVQALRPVRVLQCLQHLIRGTHPRLSEVRYVRGTEFEIRSSQRLTLAVDGDLITTGSVTFRVRPAAIQILVPSPTAANGPAT